MTEAEHTIQEIENSIRSYHKKIAHLDCPIEDEIRVKLIDELENSILSYRKKIAHKSSRIEGDLHVQLIEKLKYDGNDYPQVWLFPNWDVKLTDQLEDQLKGQYIKVNEAFEEKWDVEALFYDRGGSIYPYEYNYEFNGDRKCNIDEISNICENPSTQIIFMNGIEQVNEQKYLDVVEAHAEDDGSWDDDWTNNDINWGDWNSTPRIKYSVKHHPIILIRKCLVANLIENN